MAMLEYSDGRLTLESQHLEKLVAALDTPIFLFSEARLRANFEALDRGLSIPGGRPLLRYCAKANNEPAILSQLAGWGAHVLVSHEAEAHVALQNGFSPDCVAFQRPVLLPGELRAVIERGISLLHVHRVEDLDLIECAARELGRHIRISLRLRPDRLGWRPSPLHLFNRFGLGVDDTLRAVAKILHSRHLSLIGLNYYGGTQQDTPACYQALIRQAAALAAKILARWGISLEEINLGGGLPSPSLVKTGICGLWHRGRTDLAFPEAGDAPSALEEFARTLARLYLDESNRVGLKPLPRLTMEPGRAIVGNAAILVTRVRAIENRWIFVDASRNYLGESPLLFMRRIVPTRQASRRRRRFYHLSGATLNTMDVMDCFRLLPELVVGDLLAICDAGAYSLSRATRSGCLVPPAYLLRRDGSLRQIRCAETSLETGDAARVPAEDGTREA